MWETCAPMVVTAPLVRLPRYHVEPARTVTPPDSPHASSVLQDTSALKVGLPFFKRYYIIFIQMIYHLIQVICYFIHVICCFIQMNYNFIQKMYLFLQVFYYFIQVFYHFIQVTYYLIQAVY